MPRWLPTAVLLLAACGSVTHPRLAVAKVDTLPGRIVSVTSPGPTGWADSSTGWKLVPAGTIGGESGTPGELINPQSLAVDDAGRVYVSDNKPTIVKVFAPDGRFLHTIGREGEGPGEFRVAFVATYGTRLVVHDPRISRTSVFDSSGAFLKSWASSCCYYMQITVDTAGRVYVPGMVTKEQKRMINFTRYSLDGVVVDTVSVPRPEQEQKDWVIKFGKGNMMSTSVPATPQMTSAVNPAGGVLYGFSSDYRIAVSPTGRDTVSLFGRAWTPVPVTGAWRHATVQRMITDQSKYTPEAAVRAAFQEGDIPSTFPAFDAISVDRQGNRWLRLPNATDSVSTHFDVFDSTGRFLGPVTVPRMLTSYGGLAWGRDELLAILETEDGVPVVQRFRLERTVAR